MTLGQSLFRETQWKFIFKVLTNSCVEEALFVFGKLFTMPKKIKALKFSQRSPYKVTIKKGIKKEKIKPNSKESSVSCRAIWNPWI